jgi:hypothetical protein
MNVFGNALKYTESGHVQVSLRASDGSKATGAPTTVTLTITDSGIGMSPQFLANKAFQPFSQENSVCLTTHALILRLRLTQYVQLQFAAGTGLGLSIVRQIIENNGGKIEVNSEPSIGTKLTVKLALTKPEIPINAPLSVHPTRRSQFLSYVSRLQGRNVCILQRRFDLQSTDSDLRPIVEGLVRFTNVLSTTLQKHLKMNVIRTTEWRGHDADIFIVPELSFDYLASIRRSRVNGERAPVTIFVAMDAMEAATLRSDARVRKKESVVEIMTQPYVL